MSAYDRSVIRMAGFRNTVAAFALACLSTSLASEPGNAPTGAGAPLPTDLGLAVEKPVMPEKQNWNLHGQNTDIIQYHPGFSAPYSGPNSLDNGREVQNTESLDVMLGARLWSGAELHLDGMAWQGFGLSKTFGVAGFPNGEAFRVGTQVPDFTLSRVFVRQTIGLGGEQEAVEDDAEAMLSRLLA